jgi:hypothetical protein
MGSLIGGVLYHEVGGKLALVIFCAMSLLCCVIHSVLYECFLKHTMLPAGTLLSVGYKKLGAGCLKGVYRCNSLFLLLIVLTKQKLSP